jgi:hypothetical protein
MELAAIHDPRPVLLQPRKTYGIQGLVRGPLTKVGNIPDNTVFSWPTCSWPSCSPSS